MDSEDANDVHEQQEVLGEQAEDGDVATEMQQDALVEPDDALQEGDATMVEDSAPFQENSQTASQETVLQEPLSEYDQLRAHLKKNPHDAGAWNRLVEHAEELADMDKIKDAYEALLENYPNTSSAQIAYLQHFLNPGLFQVAESLFSRFLRPSPSVDLWKFYLVYVRQVANIDFMSGNRPIHRLDASTRILARVKQSRRRTNSLWPISVRTRTAARSGRNTLTFWHLEKCVPQCLVVRCPLTTAKTHTTWEEQQKMDALRRVYHRAVQIPLENIDQLWRELDVFENKLNKITVRFISWTIGADRVKAAGCTFQQSHGFSRLRFCGTAA